MGWIDSRRLLKFIVACQDSEDGGISDRPGNTADVYHTFFGIAGMALLGYFDTAEAAGAPHRQVDPTYALPVEVVAKLGLPRQKLTLSSP